MHSQWYYLYCVSPSLYCFCATKGENRWDNTKNSPHVMTFGNICFWIDQARPGWRTSFFTNGQPNENFSLLIPIHRHTKTSIHQGPMTRKQKKNKIKNRRTQSHFIYNQSDMDSREKGTNKNISCWIFAYKKNTTTETAEWLMKNQPQNPLDGWKVFFYCSKKFFFFSRYLAVVVVVVAVSRTLQHKKTLSLIYGLTCSRK